MKGDADGFSCDQVMHFCFENVCFLYQVDISRMLGCAFSGYGLQV